MRIFLEAADALTRPPGRTATAAPGAIELLQRLGYMGPEAEPADADLQAHRASLLRLAARLDKLFTLPTGLAPGLAAIGAMARSASFTGAGLTFREAFESCVGEASE